MYEQSAEGTGDTRTKRGTLSFSVITESFCLCCEYQVVDFVFCSALSSFMFSSHFLINEKEKKRRKKQ